MGANQSSSEPGEASSITEGPKTSYYKLLGVERNSTDDEIKKAYRKRALELHPDRNFGNEAESTNLFAAVQTAYEVLSDPHERAWYDDHEDAILGGEDETAAPNASAAEHGGAARGMTAAEVSRVMGLFGRKVAFTDAPDGFFGFLQSTFERLAHEEELASRTSTDEPVDYPPFGHAADTYEDVARPFYSAWAGFGTRKSFAWADKYRPSAANDRRERRMVEKENARLRAAAVAEFNGAVRALVAFAQKRDPRVAERKVQSEAERVAELRKAAAAQAARSRAAQRAAEGDVEAVPEWARARAADEESESEESEVEEEYECVACRKRFKSERQVEAHERSKKHLKAVQALRRQMMRDEVGLDLEGEGLEEGEMVEDDGGGEEEGAAEGEAEEEVPDAVVPNNEPIHDPEPHPAPDPADTSSEAEDEDEEKPTPSASHPPSDTEAPPPPKKLGKAALKRAKKAAQATPDTDLPHKCAACGSAFGSRSKLFQHIADWGHAAPVQGAVGGKKKKK
ncbi:DnaJ-domain-containing protein [Trichodelitschia bisporula]|uniref:DnaJ-domain-containing protein n=1 Tax=Trichodelitschia bisporula TaxID=703511 RepID=A0A6G1HVL5_9PEZI|nr:DnaJ-domain-containing protein [Trichodelitschia bisporula]